MIWGRKLKKICRAAAVLFAALVFFNSQMIVYSQDTGGAPQNAGVQSESDILIDGPAPPSAANTAREAESGVRLDGGEPAFGVFAALRAVLFLAVAALAVYGVVFLMKKSKRRGGSESAHIKLLAYMPINQKNSAAILSAGGKAWLVGLSENSVSLISEITEKEAVDSMLLEYSGRSAAESAVSFLGAIKKIIPAQGGGGAQAGVNGPERDGGLEQSRDRLRGL